jgi:predicted  nucleic acid-binding Zn-ribbon protein
MRKNVLLVICILVFLFSSIFLPTVNAKTFDIGDRRETDLGCYIYSSGAYGFTLLPDNITKIFDGNLSTGINFKKGSLIKFDIDFYFGHPLFVNNITVKPSFGGNASNYWLHIHLNDYYAFYYQNVSGEMKIHVNVTVERIYFGLMPNATDYYNFNDVIINYTPTPDPNNLYELQLNVQNLDQKFQNINNDLTKIENDIINLGDNITELKKISPPKNNGTEYNDTLLKTQIDKLFQDINFLRTTIQKINDSLPEEYDDTLLKSQIIDLSTEIMSLSETMARINSSIPEMYNDSALKSNVYDLGTENVLLLQKLGNLSFRIDNLTTELDSLYSDVQDLQATSGITEGESGAEKDSEMYQYTTNIIFGIIIIVLLLVIFGISMIVFKNRGERVSKSTTENGIYSKVMHELLYEYDQSAPGKVDAEITTALKKKYHNGDISEKTYKSLKSLIKGLEKNSRDKK